LDVLSRDSHDADKGVDYEAFNRRIEQRAGKPYTAVSRSEEEKYAVEFFREELKARPGAVLLQLSKTAVKYLLAPVDSAVILLIRLANPDADAPPQVRLLLGLVCLPLWLLAITPPCGRSKEIWAYYLLVALFMAYVLGLTSINPFLGERIRFPVLGLMLPIAAWNLSTLLAFLARRRATLTNRSWIA
jgi:hypothetical protein